MDDEQDELIDSIQQSIHSSTLNSNNNNSADIDLDTDGLQVLTRVIDKMLAKIKVDVVDTLIRISHTSAAVPPLAGDHRPFAEDTEYYLDIQIPKVSYFDETPGFNPSNPANTPTATSSPSPSATTASAASTSTSATLSESSILLPPNANETIKIITVASPTVWLRSSQNMRSSLYTHPTQSETTLQDESDDDNDLSQTEFYEAEEGDSTLFRSTTSSTYKRRMSGSTTPRAFPRRPYPTSASFVSHHKPYEALLLTTLDGESWLRMRMRPSFPFDLGEPSDQPAVRQVECMLSHVRAIITPRQTAFLYDLLQKLMDAPESQRPTPTTSQDRPSPPVPDMDSPVQRSSRPIRPPHLEGTYRSSSPAPPAPSTPGLKVKLQLTRIDAFIFYAEPQPTLASTLAGPVRDYTDTSHLRITLDNVILRHLLYQNNRPDKTKARQNRRPSIQSPRHDTQPSANAKQALLSTLDVRISDLAIDELVTQPTNHRRKATEKASQMEYGCYLPVLEFDDAIRTTYSGNPTFPSMAETYRRPQKKSRMGEKHLAVRLRVEKKRTHEVDRFAQGESGMMKIEQ